MTEDEKYMRRCIQLAQNGRKNSQPNPMVGAVVVCDGRIIGEGYHVRCGEGHAEVNALASVKEADRHLLPHSTIYVSLEPCSHYGKTPPCADLIVKTGLKRVVVGCIDPFAKVKGKGIEKIKAAGIEVVTGVLEKECVELNKRFMTFHGKGRPLVTLKWAETSDGYMGDLSDGDAVAISDEYAGMLCHKRRAEHQAIMVGRVTAERDNPSLTVRNWSGNDPVRIVLDKYFSLPASHRLFDGKVPTLLFYAKWIDKPDARPNVEYVPIYYSIDILPQILRELHDRGIQSLLVEGGRTLLQSFIESGFWDDAYVEVSDRTLSECGGDMSKAVTAPELGIRGVRKEVLQLSGRTVTHYENPLVKAL